MSNEDKKVIKNVTVIVLFALPCMLVFCNELFLKFLGVVYIIGFWDNIIKPLQERYKELVKASRGEGKSHTSGVDIL